MLTATEPTLAPAGGVWYAVNTTEPPVYPYILWIRVASPPNVSLSGPSNLQNTRIQIDIFSRQVSELLGLESALEAAMVASALQNVPLNSQNLYEEPVRAYRVTKDYSIWATN
jgi:hypothetical protein